MYILVLWKLFDNILEVDTYKFIKGVQRTEYKTIAFAPIPNELPLRAF